MNGLTSLIFPALCLGAMGWFVPKGIARFWPEGVGWLAALGVVSSVVMTALGAAFFAAFYVIRGVPLADLAATGGGALLGEFVRLSLMSGLLWVPLMILSIMYIPRGWVREVW